MKRIAAAPLWFLVGWYAGSVAAWTLGLGPYVAPLAAMALATLIMTDPLRVIWDQRSADRSKSLARLTANTDPHTA
jgi:hypothetical protein